MMDRHGERCAASVAWIYGSASVPHASRCAPWRYMALAAALTQAQSGVANNIDDGLMTEGNFWQ